MKKARKSEKPTSDHQRLGSGGRDEFLDESDDRFVFASGDATDLFKNNPLL